MPWTTDRVRPLRALLLTGPRGSGKTVLLNAIEDTGRAISDDALAVAVEGTRGHPFLIQLVGHQTWNVHRAADQITLVDAEAGVERAVRRVSRLVLEPSLRELSVGDRAFLAAMTADDGPSRMADVTERLGVSASYASQYRLRLIAAEVVEPAGYGKVAFALPYLRDHLRGSDAPPAR